MSKPVEAGVSELTRRVKATEKDTIGQEDDLEAGAARYCVESSKYRRRICHANTHRLAVGSFGRRVTFR